MSKETDKLLEVDDDLKSFYKEAFDDFDWNKNGRITCRVLISAQNAIFYFSIQELQSAMRRAGQNPTESEVQDMINKIDDGTSSLNFEVAFHVKTDHKI